MAPPPFLLHHKHQEALLVKRHLAKLRAAGAPVMEAHQLILVAPRHQLPHRNTHHPHLLLCLPCIRSSSSTIRRSCLAVTRAWTVGMGTRRVRMAAAPPCLGCVSMPVLYGLYLCNYFSIQKVEQMGATKPRSLTIMAEATDMVDTVDLVTRRLSQKRSTRLSPRRVLQAASYLGRPDIADRPDHDRGYNGHDEGDSDSNQDRYRVRHKD